MSKKIKISIAKYVYDSGTTGIRWEKVKEKLDLKDEELYVFTSKGKLSDLVFIDIDYIGDKTLIPYEKLYYMNHSEIETYFE